jgi:hypothetical protein
MDTYRRSGIVTGILFIVATAAGILAIVAQPILTAPDYLTKISANEPMVLAGSFLVSITLVLFRQIAPLSTADLLMKLAIFLQEMVLAVWLIMKGFNPSGLGLPQRGA